MYQEVATSSIPFLRSGNMVLWHPYAIAVIADIQIDVNGSVAIFMAPISVGNSTDRCAQTRPISVSQS